MKLSSIRHAISAFEELTAELGFIADLGLPPLKIMVRQHYLDVDRGWSFIKLGIDEVDRPGMDDESRSWVIWGKMAEPDDAGDKYTLVFLDPETVDSIEFEVYPAPDEDQV